MNPETIQLLRQLERATAINPIDSSRSESARVDTRRFEPVAADTDTLDTDLLDADTAALRETWLSFGQLLAAADREMPAEVTSSVVLRRSHRGQAWGWVLVCAMSLIAVSVVGWYCVSALSGGSFWQRQVAEPNVAGPRGTEPGRSAVGTASSGALPAGRAFPDVATAGDGSVGHEPVPSAALSPDLAWDDAWDTQVAQVSDRLWRVADGDGRRDLRWQYVQHEVWRISEELGSDLGGALTSGAGGPPSDGNL